MRYLISIKELFDGDGICKLSADSNSKLIDILKVAAENLPQSSFREKIDRRIMSYGYYNSQIIRNLHLRTDKDIIMLCDLKINIERQYEDI